MKSLRYVILGILVAIPVVGGLVGIKFLQFGAMSDAAAKQVMPPLPVNAAIVHEEVWQPEVASVGTVMAMQGTVIRTEAEGVVREISFEPGTTVQAGDVLVRLDADVEQAQLRVAEAAAELARSSFKRAEGLIGKRSISQADYDAAAIDLKQANAQVDNLRAVIAKKTVRAPFAGRLGIRHISVGQFLDKGSQVVSLQSLDPIYVDFSLPQQRLGDLAEGLRVDVISDAYPGARFEGEITAVNPDIDAATRNVRVQATMANPDGRLRPGMFVEVALTLDRSDRVLVIPATAVLHAPYGDSLFVVQEGGEAGADGRKPLVVQQKFVRLGAQRGDFVVVTEGVAAGERVVSTGTFKLRPGMSVVIDNSLAPDFQSAPRPDNT
ncbi:MAG: efflux RND transporter periplasmic adaptor subunit [Pseudomonadota bacterium]